MKNLLKIALAFSLSFGLVGCGTGNNSNNNDQDGGISVDENLLTVEITMDKSFYEDTTEDEIKSTADEAGFISYKINENGSVTYKMTKAKHKEFLADLKDSVRLSCDGMISGDEAVESFTKIDINDDLTQFDVYVNKNAYSSWDSLNSLAFYFYGAYYQMFNGATMDEIDVVVNFIDDTSYEVLDTGSYKELANADE